jgi:hypothetical protein
MVNIQFFELRYIDPFSPLEKKRILLSARPKSFRSKPGVNRVKIITIGGRRRGCF